jgi:hypothetical protein
MDDPLCDELARFRQRVNPDTVRASVRLEAVARSDAGLRLRKYFATYRDASPCNTEWLRKGFKVQGGSL